MNAPVERPLRLLIAEPEPIILRALEIILKSLDNVIVVGGGPPGKPLWTLLEKEDPDILFLDIRLSRKNGIDVLKSISSNRPRVKIIALSVFDHPEHIKKMFKNGARGFISKNASEPEFGKAISTVANGEHYLSPELSKSLLKGFATINNSNDNFNYISLTDRELEIIQHLSNGLKTNEIAELLFISNKTVERHKTNMLKKLNLRNSVQLVKAAIQCGIIDI